MRHPNEQKTYLAKNTMTEVDRTAGIAYLIGVLMLICALPTRADKFIIVND